MKEILVVACLGIVLAGCGASGSPTELPLADPSGGFPDPAKVAVLVLENKSYSQVIGNPQAPYLNRLARHHALETNYYAITHPSLPNYIALTGGSVAEITRDCNNCDTPGRNVVGQLDAAGLTWKAYFEDLTSSRRPGKTTSSYNPHYNPFVYYESVRGKDQNRDRVVNFDVLRSDLGAGRVPDFAWIAPGVRLDGHNGSLRRADNYASSLVPEVIDALGPDGILFLTWDEGSFHDQAGVGGSKGGGRVALIAAGGAARRSATSGIPANHYALLRTIEAGFGLRALGRAGSPTTPLLRGLLKPTGQ
jgi:hypothetical protein